MDPLACVLINEYPCPQGPLPIAEKLDFIPRVLFPARERSPCRNWNLKRSRRHPLSEEGQPNAWAESRLAAESQLMGDLENHRRQCYRLRESMGAPLRLWGLRPHPGELSENHTLHSLQADKAACDSFLDLGQGLARALSGSSSSSWSPCCLECVDWLLVFPDGARHWIRFRKDFVAAHRIDSVINTLRRWQLCSLPESEIE